ncbi:putative hmg box protein [Rosellinia necatrix]|uniref:Putative hmg box protein n=1 Tax=Rosellinia necatrix TaxID=77044 RepID=A0A1S7UJL6_ROSNE|nr:putative hmg box protein [Rosellinia necatrix]
MNYLETVFGELGISQYLGVFVDQGFDSWDTILDITESDLDALGVKLGHRRKLQRRIANYRGVAPDVSLVSPARTSIEDARHDANRADAGRADVKAEPVVAKRKYRRHPKPDEHAPERPPSAYVLFSNKMREDLKGQTLTFTEIAKLVGENWQNLGRAEKEPFERQANEAKEKYNRDLAAYKKTVECRRYNEYLREFRKRQAAQTQEKDAAKRLKTADGESIRGSSTSGTSTGPGGTTNGTGSGSESQPGSEPPPTRQQRLGSIASLSTGTSHMDDSMISPIILPQEEPNHGRRRGVSSPHSRDTSTYYANRRTSRADSQCLSGDVPVSGVPWLDPRAAHTGISQSPEAGVLSIHSGQTSHANMAPRGSGSPRSASASQPPSLRHDQSFHGSAASSSSSSHPPRTPSDASLPIHALLSSRPEPPDSYVPTPSPPTIGGQTPQPPPSLYPTQHGRMPGGFYSNSYFGNGKPGSRVSQIVTAPGMAYEATANIPHDMSSGEQVHINDSDNGLDGITALLRAREIVDRRP